MDELFEAFVEAMRPQPMRIQPIRLTRLRTHSSNRQCEVRGDEAIHSNPMPFSE
jgi:hypothetical protein